MRPPKTSETMFVSANSPLSSSDPSSSEESSLDEEEEEEEEDEQELSLSDSSSNFSESLACNDNTMTLLCRTRIKIGRKLGENADDNGCDDMRPLPKGRCCSALRGTPTRLLPPSPAAGE